MYLVSLKCLTEDLVLSWAGGLLWVGCETEGGGFEDGVGAGDLEDFYVLGLAGNYYLLACGFQVNVVCAGAGDLMLIMLTKCSKL